MKMMMVSACALKRPNNPLDDGCRPFTSLAPTSSSNDPANANANKISLSFYTRCCWWVVGWDNKLFTMQWLDDVFWWILFKLITKQYPSTGTKNHYPNVGAVY